MSADATATAARLAKLERQVVTLEFALTLVLAAVLDDSPDREGLHQDFTRRIGEIAPPVDADHVRDELAALLEAASEQSQPTA